MAVQSRRTLLDPRGGGRRLWLSAPGAHPHPHPFQLCFPLAPLLSLLPLPAETPSLGLRAQCPPFSSLSSSLLPFLLFLFLPLPPSSLGPCDYLALCPPPAVSASLFFLSLIACLRGPSSSDSNFHSHLSSSTSPIPQGAQRVGQREQGRGQEGGGARTMPWAPWR